MWNDFAFSLIVTFKHSPWKLFPSPPLSLPCHPSSWSQPTMIRSTGPEVWGEFDVPSPPLPHHLLDTSLLQGIGGRNWKGGGNVFYVTLQLNPHANFPRGPMLGNPLSAQPQVPSGTPSVAASCSTCHGFLLLEHLLLVSSPLEWGPSKKTDDQLLPMEPSGAHIFFPRFWWSWGLPHCHLPSLYNSPLYLLR